MLCVKVFVYQDVAAKPTSVVIYVPVLILKNKSFWCHVKLQEKQADRREDTPHVLTTRKEALALCVLRSHEC
jgi:hypothetical protein